jgi:hypothetical protein
MHINELGQKKEGSLMGVNGRLSNKQIALRRVMIKKRREFGT